ncbi:toll/interleukin-1 receptor domain-containing protein [Thermomonas fusca]
MDQPPAKPRTLIFISHATPQQNAMTLWLSSRLTLAGYSVWNDVERLDGGDPFWADIQHAIRSDAAKYLLLASRFSVTRNGVLRELTEADNVASKLGDRSFVIPLRVDDIPWDEMPIQANQSNGIDFSKDWGVGLGKLLATLEKDGITKKAGPTEIEKICSLYTRASAKVRSEPASALVNALRIRSLPDKVVYSFAALASESELREQKPKIEIACEQHGRLLVSFANMGAMLASAPAELGLEHRCTLTTEEFLSGGAATGPQMNLGDARNRLTSVVRQAIEGHLSSMGLKRFNFGTWYVPVNWLNGKKATYQRNDGTAAYRALTGKAKDHTWHFGFSLKVFIGDATVRLTPQVLFSADGGEPYQNQKQLRRRHCKLWWNDTWRDRLQALVSELFAETGGLVDISAGGGASILLEGGLLRAAMPVSYSEDDAYLPDEEDEFDDDSIVEESADA